MKFRGYYVDLLVLVNVLRVMGIAHSHSLIHSVVSVWRHILRYMCGLVTLWYAFVAYGFGTYKVLNLFYKPMDYTQPLC